MIIALCGGDAVGKATQAKILAERLRAEGRRVESMSFPDYTTETGRIILRMLKGESFVSRTGYMEHTDGAYALQALYLANRLEHYGTLERFAKSRDEALVLDRYWPSGLAYGQAEGLPEQWLLDIHRTMPRAFHVIIDVPASESLRRRPEARDRFERDIAKQERVREIYRRMCDEMPQIAAKVDGCGEVSEVSERVYAAAVPWLRVYAGLTEDEL